MKVTIIDDDKAILDSLKMTFNLCWQETSVFTTRLGEEGIQIVERKLPDIVILDLGLPDISGFSVLKQVRQFPSVPVIILTVRGDEADIVKGLGLGADDYIIKPFRQMEFIARVKANARRQNIPTESTNIKTDIFSLNVYQHELVFRGKRIILTRSECIIFSELVKNPNGVRTYFNLAQALWHKEYPGYDQAIRVYIKRLREKIESSPSEPEYIRIKVGEGYFLNLPVKERARQP